MNNWTILNAEETGVIGIGVYCAEGQAVGELPDFIVDNEDGCYDDGLHRAAWRGDVQELQRILAVSADNIDLQMRPFAATPLRLAAMNRQPACVAILLRHGANVDLPDRKGQTPLFCAVKNWDTESCHLLLGAGACPDGDRKNLSTPLFLACQDGYSAGVKLLLENGAQIEWPPPSFLHPLHVTVTYKHVTCFVLLLEGGADVTQAGHILHLICSKKCEVLFVDLWRQFGGSLWDRDNKGRLAVELPDNLHAQLLNVIMGTPLSLQSLCRLRIRKAVGRNRLHLLHTLDITAVLKDFLTYKDFPQVRLCLKMVESELTTSKAKCSDI